MRVLMLASLAVGVVSATAIAAAPTVFPYEAVVQNDGVTVRSGPGERYEPTMKLSTGQRLTVHRHDPGGWYMIAPPPGSFSWIDTAYVETAGDGRSVVKLAPQGDGLPPRVAIWIGSEFTSDHRTTGRQLTTGDDVTIIGEETHQTERGPTKFYKIEPPRLEHRWVKGDFVLPLSEVGNIAQLKPGKASSFATSAGGRSALTGPSFDAEGNSTPPGFPVEQSPTLLERELDRAIDSRVAVKAGPPAAQLDEARRQLSELDQQLQGMLAQGPGQWRLDEMEQAYRTLQASATPGVAGMIDARLDTIQARQAIRAEYDAFVAITTRTDRRDAELLSLQNPNQNGLSVGQGAVQLGLPQPVESQPGPPAEASSLPSIQSPAPVTLGSSGIGATSEPPPVIDVSRLDGAGIISRTPMARPGVPQHLLVAPDGRLLAYLQADQGINLDAYLGQSVGVVGRRSQEPMLRSDLIIVQQLTRVQLQP